MHIPFLHCPPSAQWEPLSILRIPGLTLWVWYRPHHLPFGVMVSVPPEVQAAFPAGFPFTLADVFLAVGVEPVMVHSVSFFGSEWQAAEMFGPYLNHTMPPVVAGTRPEIAIQVSQQAIPVVNVVTPPIPVDGANPDRSVAEQAGPAGQKMIYERIDNSWRSCIQIERQMTGLRQKLASVMAALGKLDRDLSPDERLAAEREDRDAWQEARRWVRDLGTKCHREIKSFDIGMTSAAGKKKTIAELYDQVIKPRAPSKELTNIRREFEVYRKDMGNLQKSMQSVFHAAGQNGTQRAHRVLSAIRKKIRERRAAMRDPIGGTNVDKSVRRKS